MTTHTRLLLDLGLDLPVPGCPALMDVSVAETAYIHHSRVPVAAIGYALVSPSLARGRFPTLTFLALMDKRSHMDEDEACAAAALCGASVSPPFWGHPAPFTAQLLALIDRHALWGIFERNHEAAPDTPYTVRPFGSRDDDDPSALTTWRARFKRLSELQQVVTLAILGLYNADGCARHWLKGSRTKSLHAADALRILQSHGILPDFGRLFATYPGW